tara:strand:- start:1315 stop:3096 length:1782 start_codon:yes stop_codon:yes gene_type:complete
VRGLQLSRNSDVPEWDLADLFPGPDSDELHSAITDSITEVRAFRDLYAGKIGDLSGEDLGEAISAYERIQDHLGRISSFSQLLHASDMTDSEISRFYQNIQEKLVDISADLLFFTLEINRVSKEVLDVQLQAKQASYYAPWLRDLRTLLPYQLSDEAEVIFHEKEISGSAAWVRLFDELLSRLRVKIDDSVLTLEEALNCLSDDDAARRRSAAKALGKVFADNIHTFSLITNTLMKDKSIEDGYRGHSSPAASRHLENKVEPEVVGALVSAVRESYPQLSHRYYALKARWFGVSAINYWDRNAPLPGADEKSFAWDEARDIVLSAYRSFSPVLADIGKKFFDNAWIDAVPRPGKALGAFSHSTVPSAHPYILINYLGKPRDVMTLAHELGHGVHQVLAAEQGALMSDTPLTLAETASVFGEQITFRALLKGETNPERRRCMLASKVEDMLNTVVRQIAFYEFERRVHEERKEGELLPSRIGDIWLDSQAESFGPAVRVHSEYRNFWCYIPHFVHTPFYVYAYAFGDCLVNTLYANYQDNSEGFEDRYIEMLRAGGKLRHRELLAPFNLDASEVSFWSRGLNVISDFIDQLEAM